MWTAQGSKTYTITVEVGNVESVKSLEWVQVELITIVLSSRLHYNRITRYSQSVSHRSVEYYRFLYFKRKVN